MLKAKSLRTFLTQHVPGIAENPDRLVLVIEKGGVACHATATLSYENRYTLQVYVTPFVGDIDTLFVPLLAWIAANEPQLLQHWSNDLQSLPFSYEVELLDGDEVDLTVSLELTERVIVTQRDPGGYLATPLAEPQFPDAFEGLGMTLLRRLYANANVSAETADPAWLAAHPRP